MHACACACEHTRIHITDFQVNTVFSSWCAAWCFKPSLFICSRCSVTRTQTLLRIRKLHGCLARTSVNTTGEFVRLLSRVGLLTNLSFLLRCYETLKRLVEMACFNNIRRLWNPFCCEHNDWLCGMFGWLSFHERLFALFVSLSCTRPWWNFSSN